MSFKNFHFYYKNFKPITQHFRPQVKFSSDKTDYYSEIFNMSKNGEMERLFKKITSIT